MVTNHASKLLTSLTVVSILLLSLSFHSPDVNEKNQFVVKYGDSDVGTLNALKKIDGNQINYEIKTDVKARLIKMFHVQFYLDASYKQNAMTRSAVKSVVNDNLWDASDIRWLGSCYEVDKNEEQTYKLCENKACYSTALLYFKKPAQHQQIFSESYAKYVPIEKIGNQTSYTLKLPSGNENVYHYDDEGLKKAVVNDAIVQLKFVRK